ncbi:MAG: hypothetical protein AAGF67_05340, partial [Verrucomicrobiota bacterium]
RRAIQVFLISPLVGGLLMMGFEWVRTIDEKRFVLKEAVPLEESYYEATGYSLKVETVEDKETKVVRVREKPEFGYYFVLGAFIGIISAGGVAIRTLSKEKERAKPLAES